MKALWWTGPDKIELLHDVPVPEIRPGTVKVKVAYAAICATDLHMVSQGVMNAVFREGGKALGHEGSGEIVEMGLGTEKSGLKVGDKVAMYTMRNV
jgi:threonine dehydrogenase-like Zn-dependent dehydrogenase